MSEETGTRRRIGVQGGLMAIARPWNRCAPALLLAAGVLALGAARPLAAQDEPTAANDAADSPKQAIETSTQTTAGPEAPKTGPRMDIYGFAMLDMGYDFKQ